MNSGNNDKLSSSTTTSTTNANASTTASLLNQPIVMDIGTNTTKAGFAGGSKPKIVIGTKVGRAKHVRVMPGGALQGGSAGGEDSTSGGVGGGGSESNVTSGGGGIKKNYGPNSVFVGKTLDDHRGAFILDYPMEKGCVLDGHWDYMEMIWNHIYSKQNLNTNPSEHPVLLTEAPNNPISNRCTISEIFFETYRSPALFFSPPAVLSLYASGRTTGIVLDVGEGTSHVIPVYEGYALKHSIQRSDVAGKDVTNHLLYLLRKNSGLVFTTSAERDLVKMMKEEICYVNPNSSFGNHTNTISNKDGGGKMIATSTSAAAGGGMTSTGSSTSTSSNNDKITYQLPDGQPVSISSSERQLAPEILFNTSLIGSEETNVADTLVSSIMKSDLDLRPTLFTQIVLAGGSTMIPGFGDRLLSEVRTRAPAHTRIRISAPPDRIYSAWSGGSILASLATFKNMWVTRMDYEEYGDSLMHRSGL